MESRFPPLFNNIQDAMVVDLLQSQFLRRKTLNIKCMIMTPILITPITIMLFLRSPSVGMSELEA